MFVAHVGGAHHPGQVRWQDVVRPERHDRKNPGEIGHPLRRRRDAFDFDGKQISDWRRTDDETAAPARAALRTRCARIGTSRRRLAPTSSRLCSFSTSAMGMPSAGKHRIGLLIADITLMQAMIDVVRAEPARDAAQQIQLFDGCRAARQHTQAAGALAQSGAAVSSALSQSAATSAPPSRSCGASRRSAL